MKYSCQKNSEKACLLSENIWSYLGKAYKMCLGFDIWTKSNFLTFSEVTQLYKLYHIKIYVESTTDYDVFVLPQMDLRALYTTQIICYPGLDVHNKYVLNLSYQPLQITKLTS